MGVDRAVKGRWLQRGKAVVGRRRATGAVGLGGFKEGERGLQGSMLNDSLHSHSMHFFEFMLTHTNTCTLKCSMHFSLCACTYNMFIVRFEVF